MNGGAMIIEFLENARTLRGSDARRKFRYTRRVLLKCEVCGVTREVNCTRKIQSSATHHCKPCTAARTGRANLGNPAYNAGSRKAFSDCKVGKPYINASGYTEVYVGNAFDKKERRDKYRLLHRLVAEVKSGVTLARHTLVHHVDGEKTNNNPDNLFVCESKAIHQDIHTQLESLSMQLVKAGVIQFDHSSGLYHMPHLEEILDAYRVNSGEPCVLVIEKSGDMAILSQADSETISEGATTIPLGSRGQETSKRTAT